MKTLEEDAVNDYDEDSDKTFSDTFSVATFGGNEPSTPTYPGQCFHIPQRFKIHRACVIESYDNFI